MLDPCVLVEFCEVYKVNLGGKSLEMRLAFGRFLENEDNKKSFDYVDNVLLSLTGSGWYGKKKKCPIPR